MQKNAAAPPVLRLPYQRSYIVLTLNFRLHRNPSLTQNTFLLTIITPIFAIRLAPLI